MSICPNCGAPASESDAFCGVCGTDLRASAAAPSAPSATPAGAPQPTPASPPPPPPPPMPSAAPHPQPVPPPVPGAMPPAAPVAEKPKRTGLVIGIVLGIVLLCGVLTAVGGVLGYLFYTKSNSAMIEKGSSTGQTGPATPSAGATAPDPGTSALPDESSAPTVLDRAAAQALVERFLAATQNNEVEVARALIAPAALERLGGGDLLKQKGVITGFKVAKVGGGDNVWDVVMTIQSISGPEDWQFTVGMDGDTPRIADVKTMDF